MKVKKIASRKRFAKTSRCCCLWVGVSGIAGLGVIHQGRADDTQQIAQEPLQLAQATPLVAAPLSGIPIASPPPSQNPSLLADSLKLRGWDIPVPGPNQSLDIDPLGIRTALAELGISYFVISSTTFEDNLIRHALPVNNRAQLYNGQLPTYNQSNAFYLLYDLRKYGIPDGQITIAGANESVNWKPGGPDGIMLSALTYYQTLFNKRVEFKIGYLNNTLEFLGTQVGGSLVSGIFGVSSPLVVETGQNSAFFTTPGVNVKVYLPNNFYDKIGLQRSLDPGSVAVERAENPSATRFVVPGSAAYVIDEFGYRVNAAPGQYQTWIRGAGTFSAARYTDLSTGKAHQPNYGLFFLADRQLLQLAPHAGPGSAVRGIYAGVSAEYAPKYFNTFTQYFEGRIYGFGLIPGRPFDLLSLVANRNVFSENTVQAVEKRGLLAHQNANSYTASYSYRLIHGVNINFGISYIDHPTTIAYTRSTGSALNALLNAFIIL